MEQKEKQSLVTLITTILIIGFYSVYVFNRYIEPDPEIINDYKFWGKTFVVLIPVAVISQILIHIVFSIITRIISKEDISTVDDERDKLIELKSIRISHWVFTLGFMLAMGSQALGMQPWVMFITLIGSGFLSGIISEAVKISYYRRGV